MTKPKPIPDHFRELFSCDPITGAITRKVRCGVRLAGTQVAANRRVSPNGYVYTFLRVDRCEWMTHRVVWFLCNGEQPPTIIDHRNGNTSDNRLGNLRRASPSTNAANAKSKRDRALPKGVTGTLNGKFRACIMVNYRQIGLGTHASPELAHEAYMSAARRYFGEFARAA